MCKHQISVNLCLDPEFVSGFFDETGNKRISLHNFLHFLFPSTNSWSKQSLRKEIETLTKSKLNKNQKSKVLPEPEGRGMYVWYVVVVVVAAAANAILINNKKILLKSTVVTNKSSSESTSGCPKCKNNLLNYQWNFLELYIGEPLVFPSGPHAPQFSLFSSHFDIYPLLLI